VKNWSRGGLRNVLSAADDANTVPAGLGYGSAPSQEETKSLIDKIQDQTPAQLERIELCEHHAEILAINEKIRWHASETERLAIERKERQGKVAEIIAKLGIAVQ
jgi:hypothetical protein